MYVDDPARPTIVGWATSPVHSAAAVTPEAPSPQTVAEEPAAPWSSPGRSAPPPAPWTGVRARSDGLSQLAGRLIAGSFAVAWILCPLVEPLPTDDLPYPLWQLPIDLATLGSMVAAVVVLWRGGRLGALLGAVAGVFMLLETAMCPIAGHTTVGWWTWAQTGLSLFVLGTGVVLLARQDPPA
jgi:hypothetical protein